MNIQFIDFKEQYSAIKNKVDDGLREVFEKSNFILGQEVKDFEDEFARYCEAQYGVGVNSGTDALYLALSALGVGPGDEVIVPTFTFIATALCVSYTGAKVKFIDIENDTYNIDPNKLAKAINKRTKAIIPVHIYGQPSNMDEINAIAKKHKISIVEDAAQAHGSTYKGRRSGSLGDVACFSFYPTKSLGAFGDAGMIITSNKKIYENALMLRDYGRSSRYDHKIKGHNSRMDTIQAVVLSAKLKFLDEWNMMRNEVANYYNELLKDVKAIKTPTLLKDRTHVYQTYAIRVKNRNKVADKMKEKGISVLIHYPIPLHLQEAYKELKYKKGDFPVSEKISNEILSLPMYPHMRPEQTEYVCETLKSIVK
jgi:dTDP-4-amino-4,6-dideoxygalactose transaminase